MKAVLWFIGLAATSFAAFMGLVADAPQIASDVPKAVPSLAGAAAVLSPSSSLYDMHWPSLLAGTMLGLALAGMLRISWLDMPRRLVRWLILNERNFYRLGMAAACLAVLIFY